MSAAGYKHEQLVPTQLSSPASPWLQQEPWIFREFQQATLRYKERYHRPLSKRTTTTVHHAKRKGGASNPNEKKGRIVLIPDGAFLRKYLGFLEEFLSHCHKQNQIKSRTEGGKEGLDSQLLLLESAAECMDYRNSSPSISLQVLDKTDKHENDSCILAKEAAAANERQRIIKLCQSYHSDSNNASDNSSKSCSSVNVLPIPDLSYRNDRRDDDNDEFDLFDYANMSVEDRSRCSLLRVTKLYSKYYKDAMNPEMSNTTVDMDIILLTEDEVHLKASDLGLDIMEEYGDNSNYNLNSIQAMNCDGFISYLQEQNSAVTGLNLFDQHGSVDDGNTSDKWMELRKKCEDDYSQKNKPFIDSGARRANYLGHSTYLTAEEQIVGLTRKDLFKGKLQVTDENPREAYVSIQNNSGSSGEGGKMTYFLNRNSGHFNRAIHEDMVVIEPLPEDLWEVPVGRTRLVRIRDEGDDDETSGNNSTNTKSGTLSNSQKVPTARVVALHKTTLPRRKLIATLPQATNTLSTQQRNENAYIFLPMDMRMPKIRIKSKLGLDKVAHKRILVEIDGWEIGSTYPHGHFVKIIGDVGELETEISCLLIERGIDLTPFSASALSCLPSSPNIPDEEIQKRRDLRQSCRIFSVDPPGCQDIDDAMHAKTLPNGDIEVGVHIADVTHFLHKDSPLDKEASKRSTTFYLVDRRFDMLPGLLSSDLCSLHGKLDRLAVSVIWTLSSDLEEVKSVWYGRTVIHNIQAMTYDQAHNILHDQVPDDNAKQAPPPLTAGAPVDKSIIPHLKKDLSILTKLALKLKSKRETIGGAVDLSGGDRGTELKFSLDENGNPTKIMQKQEKQIHHTIAELMIMANGFVGKTIYKHFPDISLLRIHRAVEEDSFQELESLLKAGGLHFDGKNNMALAQTLKNANSMGGKQKHLQSVFQSLATRAMSEAQYVCTGVHDQSVGLAHYGLGIDLYTHFTSPIRRYADVVVHHLLLATLSMDQVLKNDAPLNKNIAKQVTPIIPESQAMSVLSGEKVLKNDDDIEDYCEEECDDLLDSLIEDVVDLTTEDRNTDDSMSMNIPVPLYKQKQLADLCTQLNEQNRKAKASSMQCQRLFLSLYFRTNVDVAPAVVVGLRQNGLLVYVPKYDLKGPVYLDGQCVLHESNNNSNADAKLELRSPEKELGQKGPIIFQRLDVITVQLSCDFSESVARIPAPRLNLSSLELKKFNSQSQKTNAIDSKQLQKLQSTTTSPDSGLKSNKLKNVQTNPPPSMFHILTSIPIVSNLDDDPLRFQVVKEKKKAKTTCTKVIPGRLVFGSFRNAETRSAMQEFSAANLARQHQQDSGSSLSTQAMNGGYDASRQIEREATARIQRLAAVKRNNKRSKAFKK